MKIAPDEIRGTRSQKPRRPVGRGVKPAGTTRTSSRIADPRFSTAPYHFPDSLTTLKKWHKGARDEP
jgi:hypothetical protein